MISQLILFLLTLQSAFATADYEKLCEECTENNGTAFLKIIHSAYSHPEYVCRQSTKLVSKYGIIVDHSCKPSECINITTRPISRSFGRMEIICDQSEEEQLSTHRLTIVMLKDYLEIIFLSCFLGLLLLKKSLFEQCLKKKLFGFFDWKPEDENQIQNSKSPSPIINSTLV